jgi:2-oxoglutarate-Fe(II)-dependent oxygenase superfamily protein
VRDGVPRVDSQSLGDAGAPSEVLSALQHFGCCVIADIAAVCDTWPLLLAAAKRLHGAEPAVRYGAWRGQCSSWRGYQPSQPAAEGVAAALQVDPAFLAAATNRRHSAFDVGPPWSTVRSAGTAASAGILDGPQPWPAIAGFAEEVTDGFVACHRFGVDLARRLLADDSLPPETVVPSLDGPCSMLRLLRYDPTPVEGEPHIDYELLTMVASDAPGLQVRDVKGEWRQPELGPGDLLLMAGDMLEATTRGAVGSALHRVTSTTGVRHSAVVFVGVEFGLELVMPATGRRMPFGQYLEGMLIRTTPELWSRYESGALKVPYALPEPNPFKGEPWRRPAMG